MKAPPFAYHRPGSLDEALGMLAALPNARLLAGGQSLMPLMNLRMAMPDNIIDLERVAGLAEVVETESDLRIGSMVRQRAVQKSDLAARLCPLLKDALAHVGHQQTRNRGTIGGSVCHLDPTAELPLVAAACDAVLTVKSPRGLRAIPYSEFPRGYLSSQLEADEVLIHIDFPKWEKGTRHAFIEFARRPGDFAILAVAVLLTMEPNRKVSRARVAMAGLDPFSQRMGTLEKSLEGCILDTDLIADVTQLASNFPAEGDAQNPAEYRQHLAGVLLQRALESLCDGWKDPT